MFNKYLLTFLIIILFLSSISCSFASIFHNHVYVDDSTNNTDFYITPKGDFSFSLKSNPTTGYSWNYTITGGEASFIDKKFYQEESYNSVVGMGGYEDFKFKFNNMGFVEVVFDYSRPWENSSICKKKFIIFAY